MSVKTKVPLNRYQRNKSNFLHQFGIYLDEAEERELKGKNTEIAVDNWARARILEALGEESMQTLLRPY